MPVLRLNTSRRDLRDEGFTQFLKVCFAHADRFSLAKFPPTDYDIVPNGAEVLLKPYEIQTLTPDRWYGYPRYGRRMVQTIYQAVPESLDILLQCYQDVFLQKRNRVPKVSVDTVGFRSKWVSILEDLCFWQGQTMLLGTVSHEYICSTNRIDDTFADALCQVADWLTEEIPDPFMTAIHR